MFSGNLTHSLEDSLVGIWWPELFASSYCFPEVAINSDTIIISDICITPSRPRKHTSIYNIVNQPPSAPWNHLRTGTQDECCIQSNWLCSAHTRSLGHRWGLTAGEGGKQSDCRLHHGHSRRWWRMNWDCPTSTGHLRARTVQRTQAKMSKTEVGLSHLCDIKSIRSAELCQTAGPSVL